MPKLGICNKQFLNENFTAFKSDFEKSHVCLVIYEVISKLTYFYDIDYIIKIPFNKKDKFLRLSEATILKEREFLISKQKYNEKKWNSTENCDFALLTLNDNIKSDLQLIQLKENVNKNTPVKIQENKYLYLCKID